VIAQACDPTRFVDRWLRADSEEALREFLRFAAGEGWNLLVRGEGNGFWPEERVEILRTALADPERLERLVRTARENPTQAATLGPLAESCAMLAAHVGGSGEG